MPDAGASAGSSVAQAARPVMKSRHARGGRLGVLSLLREVMECMQRGPPRALVMIELQRGIALRGSLPACLESRVSDGPVGLVLAKLPC
jgi:hypothetical protein